MNVLSGPVMKENGNVHKYIANMKFTKLSA